jgi:poly(3-hydroxyalkanoate) synthetase
VAKTEQGSWWPDYAGWLADRSGAEKPARDVLGSAHFAELGTAPGSYVLDR